jgi:hypothetical protein
MQMKLAGDPREQEQMAPGLASEEKPERYVAHRPQVRALEIIVTIVTIVTESGVSI